LILTINYMRITNELKLMVARRRDKLEVIEDLLKAADKPDGANKTHLVYESNLNFNRLNVFLPYLLKNGLIESESENKYITTMKGREFLKQLHSMHKML